MRQIAFNCVSGRVRAEKRKNRRSLRPIERRFRRLSDADWNYFLADFFFGAAFLTPVLVSLAAFLVAAFLAMLSSDVDVE